MKKIVLIVAMAMVAVMASAIPAKPGMHRIVLADGSEVQAQLVGDEFHHCFVTEVYNKDNPQCGLPVDDSDLVEFCVVKEPKTGHEMSVYTNLEGCQFYTANYIKGIQGKNGKIYESHEAFCLETQAFPDSPNQKGFPTCILEPGQKMKAKTVYSFK